LTTIAADGKPRKRSSSKRKSASVSQQEAQPPSSPTEVGQQGAPPQSAPIEAGQQGAPAS